MTGLEDTFDVIVEDEELTEEMLTSTHSVATYIDVKLRQKPLDRGSTSYRDDNRHVPA